jgi:hypothetical protein
MSQHKETIPELEGLKSWRAWGIALALTVGMPAVIGVIEAWKF